MERCARGPTARDSLLACEFASAPSAGDAILVDQPFCCVCAPACWHWQLWRPLTLLARVWGAAEAPSRTPIFQAAWSRPCSSSHALRAATFRKQCRCKCQTSHVLIFLTERNRDIKIKLLSSWFIYFFFFSGVHDYELTLRHDLYTTKHTQWFYFQVQNMKAGVTYRFTIVNLLKSSSLYNSGMRPLLYSVLASRELGRGWTRAGANIKYYRNNRDQDGRPLYSLTWTFEFPYERDTCYLAHCYPYTYSDLQRYLCSVMHQPSKAAYCKLRILCRSLAGNPVYVLTITAPGSSPDERRVKQAVVVTARVHPGETNSSWIMQGFLDFLLGDSPDACLLRDMFVFKVINDISFVPQYMNIHMMGLLVCW